MSNQQHAVTQKSFAVITGASSGIGYELAKQFAANGYDILVTGENEAISAAADTLARSGASVRAFAVDLTAPDGVQRLVQEITGTGRPLDAIAINAGVGIGGDFRTTDLAAELRLIDLNCKSTVSLAKHVVPMMTQRGSGRILFTASIAAIMPDPYEAVYGASKAFVHSFAFALRNELKSTGVTVTTMMPGPTDTNFFHRAEMDDTKVGSDKKDDPAEVARQGFEALVAGHAEIVAGSFKTKAQAAIINPLPETAKAEVHRGMAEPNSAGR